MTRSRRIILLLLAGLCLGLSACRQVAEPQNIVGPEPVRWVRFVPEEIAVRGRVLLP